jgi:hypothetical protein
MRKFIFIGFVVAGSSVGLLSTLGDGWGLKLFMTCLGALSGAAFGGALSRIGRNGRPMLRRDDTLRGLGTTSEDLMDNYWRDEGHPQFMKPPSSVSEEFGGTGGIAD